jgi:hypothetical protein
MALILFCVVGGGLLGGGLGAFFGLLLAFVINLLLTSD